MKIVLAIILSLFTFSILAQEKIYTKGLPNGYACLKSSVSTPVFSKEESLLAMVQRRLYLQKSNPALNEESFPLGCEEYIDSLLNQGKSGKIDIKEIIKIMDHFYSVKENLVIPVLGAYCYSVKKFLGRNDDQLDTYRTKLLEYSKK